MRDFQVSKVYAAEHVFKQHSKPSFSSREDAIAWLKKIAMAEKKQVAIVVDNHRTEWASCETETKIVFPGRSDWWQNELVMLHELAHTGIHWAFAHHGQEFCAEFLRLLKLYHPDPTMRYRLKCEYDKRGVKYKRDNSIDKSIKRKIKTKQPEHLVLSTGVQVVGKFTIDGDYVVDGDSGKLYYVQDIAYV